MTYPAIQTRGKKNSRFRWLKKIKLLGRKLHKIFGNNVTSGREKKDAISLSALMASRSLVFKWASSVCSRRPSRNFVCANSRFGFFSKPSSSRFSSGIANYQIIRRHLTPVMIGHFSVCPFRLESSLIDTSLII